MRIERKSKSESGIAVLIVLALISFMVAFIAANSGALFHLKREIQLVDRRQQKRWNQLSGGAATNAAIKTNVVAKTNAVDVVNAPSSKP
jgi:hypothetical protein